MRWSRNLGYIVGLITTDGSLSKDGRHINLTSKDLEQIHNFKRILKLKNKIGRKKSGYSKLKKYYFVEFGDVKFYRFITSLGLRPNKTKTLGEITIPDKYFSDFLRGHLDGDGYTYSYWDKRWKSSFMLYTGFISASQSHLEWIKRKITQLYDIEGSTVRYSGKSIFRLTYAKRESVLLLKRIYRGNGITCLKRKRKKITKALGIISKQAGMLKSVYRHA